MSIRNKINLSKDFSELYDIPWEMLQHRQCGKQCARNIKILILNAPCNGFGDLMFAHKLGELLRSVYGSSQNNFKVDIATTLPDKLLLLGGDKKIL